MKVPIKIIFIMEMVFLFLKNIKIKVKNSRKNV